VVGRIAPVKCIELALEVVKSFIASDQPISLTIVGEASEKDISYYDSLVRYVSENNLSEHISFHGAVAPNELPSVYSQYHVCLNLTESGSFDKTIVESSACGAVPVVTNRSLAGLLPPECLAQPNVSSVVQAITQAFDPRVERDLAPKLAQFVQSQSLSALSEKLFS
jgi:glycosyltransferase involved in cell wall biosynthesis